MVNMVIVLRITLLGTSVAGCTAAALLFTSTYLNGASPWGSSLTEPCRLQQHSFLTNPLLGTFLSSLFTAREKEEFKNPRWFMTMAANFN